MNGTSCTCILARIRACAVALLVTFACSIALVPIAGVAPAAYAAPAPLDVTFSDAMGIATWKAVSGADEYWFEYTES